MSQGRSGRIAVFTRWLRGIQTSKMPTIIPRPRSLVQKVHTQHPALLGHGVHSSTAQEQYQRTTPKQSRFWAILDNFGRTVLHLNFVRFHFI